MSHSETLRIMCPNLTCKKILAVPVSARGKTVRCRGCGTNIRVPSPETAKEPAALKPQLERLLASRRLAHELRTMSQEEICALLVSKALDGKSVVRLKGGDPFIFGRGGTPERQLHLVDFTGAPEGLLSQVHNSPERAEFGLRPGAR